MTSGQPAAKIKEDQCQRLAALLSQRKPTKPLPAAVNLFSLGKVSIPLGVLLLLLTFWALGSQDISQLRFLRLLPALAGLLALVMVPALLMGLMQGIKLGLFGLAEYICGLVYTGTKMLGGSDFQRRTDHTLGLLYNGTGRFQEALLRFGPHEIHQNVFDKQNSTPWNERKRVAELLARVGLTAEAISTAEQYVEKSRAYRADLDSREVRDNLQCELILAARILAQAGDKEKAIVYLEEAFGLGAVPDRVDLTPPHPTQAQKLALLAQGLFYMYKEDFVSARDTLEKCSQMILERRLTSPKVSALYDGELLGTCQNLLGQCYVKCGQAEKLEAVVALLTRENMAEPPASNDKVSVALLDVDHKLSQGKSAEALPVIEKTVNTLLKSDADYDQTLVEAVQKYQTVLMALGRSQDAESISKALEHLNAPLEARAKLLHANTIALLKKDNSLKLPDLTATRAQANKSLMILIVLLSLAAGQYILHPADFKLTTWAIVMLLTLALLARPIMEQVRMRRANLKAGGSIKDGRAIDVVLAADKEKAIPGACLARCFIQQGPPGLQGRKLVLANNQHVLIISQAVESNPLKTIGARIYLCPRSDKILAIETLGKVLTVAREQPPQMAQVPPPA